MLRYDRQTKPGLVALYDIRPGNGVGPFLQPWSLHGARARIASIVERTAVNPDCCGRWVICRRGCTRLPGTERREIGLYIHSLRSFSAFILWSLAFIQRDNDTTLPLHRDTPRPPDTLEQRMQYFSNMWNGTFVEFRWDVITTSPAARPFFSFFTALTTSSSVGSSVHIAMSGRGYMKLGTFSIRWMVECLIAHVIARECILI